MRKFSPFMLYVQIGLVLGIAVGLELLVSTGVALGVTALSVYVLEKINRQHGYHPAKVVAGILGISFAFMLIGGLEELLMLQTTSPILLAIIGGAQFIQSLPLFSALCVTSFGLLTATMATIGLSTLVTMGARAAYEAIFPSAADANNAPAPVAGVNSGQMLGVMYANAPAAPAAPGAGNGNVIAPVVVLPPPSYAAVGDRLAPSAPFWDRAYDGNYPALAGVDLNNRPVSPAA